MQYESIPQSVLHKKLYLEWKQNQIYLIRKKWRNKTMNEQDLSDMRAAAHELINKLSKELLSIAYHFLKSLAR